jgi:hypothetical protein
VPEKILIQRPWSFLSEPYFLAILFVLVLTSNAVLGQSVAGPAEQRPNAKPVQAANALLPDRLGEQWKAVTPAQVLPQRATELPDQDVLEEYGLQRVIRRVYSDGKIKTSVDVFEMNFISTAYGLFTFNRGRLSQNSREFYEGRYVVRATISSPDATLAGGQLEEKIFEAIKPRLNGGEGQLPSLPLHLPAAGKIPGSEKYIVGPAALIKLKSFGELKDAINFGAGVEMVTADYQNGAGQASLLIIEYPTPQTATDGLAQIQAYFNSLPQNEKDRRILKRIGNYIVEAVNIQDMPAAQNLVGQIKYQTKVYWAGKKFTDIPLDYRPTDPVAIDEAVRTTQVLVRSFYWMGAMLLSAVFLGLVAGGAFFGWTVYRRRKLGLDNLFSDAGGSIRLNLDDYLLSGDSDVKRLDDGNKR